MVNIVVVSHSRKLAEGVVELASQMTQGRVKFAVAAGIEDPENPIGTDPIAVMTAIQEVQNDSGVLVMVDVGSALLSTDMALELLGEDVATQVQVCAAPLVEGTVAAAVAAASGQEIGRVAAEAHQAIAVKYVQLNQRDQLQALFPPIMSPAVTLPTVETASALSFSWKVANPDGIHARPASAIATCLSRYDVEVQLVKAGQGVNAKSVNSIALLAIKHGDEIRVQASGAQAREAIDAFSALARAHFGDRLEETKTLAPTSASNPRNGNLHLAVCRVERALPSVLPRAFRGEQTELAMLRGAIDAARDELTALIAFTAQRLSDNEAAIFAAQRMMLEDDELFAAAAKQMTAHPAPIDGIWLAVIEPLAREYQAIKDTYLRERYIDIYDVGLRVLQQLNHPNDHSMAGFQSPVLLVANLLLPSEVVKLDPQQVNALYFTEIGITSHAAILAVAMGIPVFIDSGKQTQPLRHGEKITLDVATGDYVVD